MGVEVLGLEAALRIRVDTAARRSLAEGAFHARIDLAQIAVRPAALGDQSLGFAPAAEDRERDQDREGRAHGCPGYPRAPGQICPRP